MQVTFGSLFAGIGGFDLGFERAGMVCKWQVEIDDYATRVLAKHWPDVHRERDIRQCGSYNLQRVDVICGGFPCQDISYAGRGAGLAGERSGLFFEAVRLVRQLRPRAVVLENVAALYTRGLDVVLGTLAGIGYGCEWHCIPAAAVGAPHLRKRVFIVAYAGCQRRQQIGGCAFGDEKENERWSTNEDHKPCGCSKGCKLSQSASNVAYAGQQRPRRAEKVDGQAAIWQQRIADATGGGWWETEPAVGRVANGIPNRVHRLRGLGNAVVPQVAEVVGKRVLDILR